MAKQLFPNIEVKEGVRFGKPVIAGTRIPVALIVGKIAGGMTVDEVVKEFDLKKEEVRAALSYAAEIISHEEIASL